jgi:DNA-binding IclR family transcriptional regulator
MGTRDEPDGRRIQSLQKAFNILEALDDKGGMSVSEAADETDMPVSTVHLYLQTLEETGYVVRRNGNYALGLRFLETGSRVRNRLEIFQAAQREMISLCCETGERVGLGVAENGKRVQLWQIEGEDAVSDNNHIGEFTHMHWTSLGKALLSQFSDARIEEIVTRHGLPRATDRTITDPADLFTEIRRIRRNGYALEDEERKPGMRSISVPLWDTDEEPIGAIGIAGAKSRLTASKCDEYVECLREKANIVSLRYSY